MPTTNPALRAAPQLIDPTAVGVLEVLGPRVRIVTPLTGDDRSPCLLRGTIPAGGVVPLHSHPEPETFIALDGAMEGLVGTGKGLRWVALEAGGVLHVPGGVPHAWRNRSDAPAESYIVTEEGIARFFREVGTPITAADGSPASEPSPADLERFAGAAKRFGHWLAGPEENAAIGIVPPGKD